jgi:hypothetical protein
VFLNDLFGGGTLIYVLNAGYLLMLIGLTIRNILALRIVLVSAQSMFVVYGILNGHTPMYFWNGIFICINIIQVILLYREKKPVELPEEIIDIYENIFTEMTPREFLYFWQTGNIRTTSERLLIQEGALQEEVFLILEGKSQVKKDGKEIAVLKRGDFVAEMSFLTGETASADVLSIGSLTYIAWNQNDLGNLDKLNHKLWVKLQSILGKHLAKKIKKTSMKV